MVGGGATPASLYLGVRTKAPDFRDILRRLADEDSIAGKGRSVPALRDTDDPAQARAARNPENAPHLAFTDFGGYGYATVRASPDELETEFVCIPPLLERAETEDGGPLRYRVVARHLDMGLN